MTISFPCFLIQLPGTLKLFSQVVNKFFPFFAFFGKHCRVFDHYFKKMNHLKKQIIDAIVNKVDKRFRIIRDWSFKFPQKNSLKPNLKKMIYVDGSVTRSGFVVKYVIIFKFFFDSSLLLWNKKWKNWHCRVLGRRCRKLFRDLFLILVGFVINPPPTRLKFQLHLHQHWITQEIPSHTHSIDPTHFYFPLTSFDKKKYFDEKKTSFNVL